MREEDCSISVSVEDCSYCVMFSLISNHFTFAGVLRVPSADLIVSCKWIPKVFVTIYFFKVVKKKPTKYFCLLNVCIVYVVTCNSTLESGVGKIDNTAITKKAFLQFDFLF